MDHLSFQDKQLKSESVQHTDAAILAEHKKKQGEAAKKGKQPFYLSKSIAILLSLSLSKYICVCVSLCFLKGYLMQSGVQRDKDSILLYIEALVSYKEIGEKPLLGFLLKSNSFFVLIDNKSQDVTRTS